ncbi:MAG: M23 family metallopeptidase [Ginsengibacter sp.]
MKFITKYLLTVLIFILQSQFNLLYSQMITITWEGRKIVPITEVENNRVVVDSTIVPAGKKTFYENDYIINFAFVPYTIYPPLPGKLFVTSSFGERFHPILQTEILHEGIDLRANYEAVRSIANGIIVKEGYDSRAGNYIVIQHGNGIESIYCHLSKFFLRSGDLVFAGNSIAMSGATGAVNGPHLHFAIKVNGKFIDPESLLKPIVGYNGRRRIINSISR